MMTYAKDQRKEKRFNKKLIIKFRRNRDNVISMSLTENISFGGAYFFSLESFNIAEILFCEIFSNKYKENISVEARIVRVELLTGRLVPTYGIGVEFCSAFNNRKKCFK